jgi:putative ABC transport system permease protein
MFKNYLTVAWRTLTRNKIYSSINIAGLSIGLAAVMLIILYVKDEVSFDKFHSRVHQIYRITTVSISKDGTRGKKGAVTGYLQGPRFSANIPEIKSFVRIQDGREDFKIGTDIVSKELLYADTAFFSVFSFPLLDGSAGNCLTDPHSIVLSENESRKQFGTTNAIGKIVLIKNMNEFIPYRVSGIAKTCPQNSSIKFDIILPLQESKKDAENTENWFNYFLNTFVVLPENANLHIIESKMDRFFNADSKDALISLQKQYGDDVLNWKNDYHLQPFSAMHLSTDLPAVNGLSDASNPVYSYILSGIALFILLIATINFVNLSIARSIRRSKEIGIRKVIGGARKQLIVQFLGESFLLCFIAFLVAIVIAELALPVFNELSNKSLSLSYLSDAKLVGGYILLFVFTGLMAGFYPALILSGYDPVQTLYSRINLHGKNYLQKTLVVIQFSLASFLIITTFTSYAQFRFLTTEKLGYDDTDLVRVNKPDLKRDEAILFRNELAKNSNIQAVTFKNTGGWSTVAKVNIDSTLQFDYETIDEAYMPLLKIKLSEGRYFSKDFPSDSSHSVLVNESFVRAAGWKNPIGQTVDFWFNKEKFTVIGVVKDYHYNSLITKIGPQLFIMKDGNYGTSIIKIKPKTETAGIKYIEQIFKKLFPANPYSYVFISDSNRENYESESKWKQIMFFSAILTIFISCIGLFGLSVLSAEKRTKEIGIRKVLGASIHNIITTLIKDFLKLVIIALCIAVPLAWLSANKWLENYPYRILLNWEMFAAGGLVVISIAVITVSFQSIKAALANPADSLRTE